MRAWRTVVGLAIGLCLLTDAQAQTDAFRQRALERFFPYEAGTPQVAGVPLPERPTMPTAWLSSTITIASSSPARSQMDLRSAKVPSMENTPSVAIMRYRAPRASTNLASSSAMSLLA